jgi:hypothetical protein
MVRDQSKLKYSWIPEGLVLFGMGLMKNQKQKMM